ncbi:MAG: response regulator [Anaerolineae bacterium]
MIEAIVVSGRGVAGTCLSIRQATSVPILALLPSMAEVEVLEAFSAGADDCQSAIIGDREVVLRIRALLRRARRMGAAEVRVAAADTAKRRLRDTGRCTMDKTILVVDDDRKIVDLVSLYLRREGYTTLTAGDGHEALEMARRQMPDLIVLDLLLPGLDGIDVCRLLRVDSRVPIIMLTARSTDRDKLTGLDIGADDYVTKPFNPRELVARVRAVLRRTAPTEEASADMRFGDLEVSFVRHEVLVAGQPANLTPTEFRLLEAMVREPRRAFSRSELLDRAFGSDYEGLERTVDVHIMNLRRKIETEPSRPRYIATVPGVGYRFEGSHVA